MQVTGIDGSTSAGRTAAEVAARRALMRIYRFLRSQPGLKNLTIDFTAAECGIRESCTIRGKKRITARDYAAGRVWEDAVCYSFYPIDIHRPSGDGVDLRPLAEGTFPTIPRGAMLPLGSSWLFGRRPLYRRRPGGQLGLPCASVVHGDGPGGGRDGGPVGAFRCRTRATGDRRDSPGAAGTRCGRAR